MGQLTLDRVVVALNEAGIRAERAYPMGKMPEITDIAATVCLQKASVRDRNLTVLVTVFAPMSVGASACEETALIAGDVLRFHGGKASVGDCQFNGRTGLFSAEVTGVFADGLEIMLDGVPLAHAVSLTSWREIDDIVTDIDGVFWYFRLEEFFPWGAAEEAPCGEPFTLVCNSRESYEDCRWISQERIAEVAGTRQIREAVVGSRTKV